MNLNHTLVRAMQTRINTHITRMWESAFCSLLAVPKTGSSPMETPLHLTLRRDMESVKRAIARALNSDALHYAIIPAIIIVGMNTTPKPSILSLLTPI